MNTYNALRKKVMMLSLVLIVISVIPAKGLEASLNLISHEYQIKDVDSSTKTVLMPAEVLTSASTNSSYKPEVFVDSSNNIHVAWQEEFSSLPDRIHYTFWDATTGTWNATETVNKESDGDGYNPTLAVDDEGNVYIAWDDRGDYGGSGTDADIFFRIWNATINAWSDIEVVSVGDATSCYRSSLGLDSENNVYISWMNYEAVPAPTYAIFNIYYNFRNAITGVWNGTETISDTTPDASQNPSLVVDKYTNIHIVWRTSFDYGSSGSDADIVYRVWNATTDAWSTTEVISTDSTDASYYPFIATDIMGNTHIVWHDATNYNSAGTDYDIFYTFWNATTDTWNGTEVISTESDQESKYPIIAVDTTGSVRITWRDHADYAGAGTDADIFYKYLDSAATSWSAAEVISTLSDVAVESKISTGDMTILAESNYSTTPALALDAFGNYYIVWCDNTDYLGADEDPDIFFRKTISFSAPTLASISPDPSTTGDITLNWDEVDYATQYYLYRSTSDILTVEGLVPITTTPLTSYNDLSLSNGTYYYVIIANIDDVNSSLSNIVSVEVAIPPLVSEFPLRLFTMMTGLSIGIIALIVKRRRGN